jgi:hypothetical protein
VSAAQRVESPLQPPRSPAHASVVGPRGAGRRWARSTAHSKLSILITSSFESAALRRECGQHRGGDRRSADDQRVGIDGFCGRNGWGSAVGGRASGWEAGGGGAARWELSVMVMRRGANWRIAALRGGNRRSADVQRGANRRIAASRGGNRRSADDQRGAKRSWWCVAQCGVPGRWWAGWPASPARSR